MIVTELVPVGKTRQKVYLDYEYAFLLSNREVRLYKIKNDEELDTEVYEEIIQELILPKAKLKAMDLLKSCDRTEYELLSKLKTAGFNADVGNQALDYVKQYNYVNDYRYACNYISFRKSSRSKKMIILELTRKGVDKLLILQAVEQEYQEDMEEEAILREIKKKCTKSQELTYEMRMKVSASLFRKGYSADHIRKVFDQYMDDMDC